MTTTLTTNLNALKEKDLYTLLLFVLYKTKDIPEYSTLSELAYLLDKNSLLTLCEYYGGLTITIPTITELEMILNALLLYQKVDIEKQDLKEQLKMFNLPNEDRKKLLAAYEEVKRTVANYSFTTK